MIICLLLTENNGILKVGMHKFLFIPIVLGWNNTTVHYLDFFCVHLHAFEQLQTLQLLLCLMIYCFVAINFIPDCRKEMCGLMNSS